MGVCTEEDEPRMAAILSEMSLLAMDAEVVASVALVALSLLDDAALIADFGGDACVAETGRDDAAALAGKLPPKWAAMAAARAALDGMGPSPTMLRKAAGDSWGAAPLVGRALPAAVDVAEMAKGVWAGGRGAPLGPRAG